MHEIKIRTRVSQGISLLKMVFGNVIEQNMPCCSWLRYSNCEFTGRAPSDCGRWACFEVTQNVGFPLLNIIKSPIAVEDMEETVVKPSATSSGLLVWIC